MFFNCILFKEWYETHYSHPGMKSTNGDFSVGFLNMQRFIW